MTCNDPTSLWIWSLHTGHTSVTCSFSVQLSVDVWNGSSDTTDTFLCLCSRFYSSVPMTSHSSAGSCWVCKESVTGLNLPSKTRTEQRVNKRSAASSLKESRHLNKVRVLLWKVLGSVRLIFWILSWISFWNQRTKMLTQHSDFNLRARIIFPMRPCSSSCCMF